MDKKFLRKQTFEMAITTSICFTLLAACNPTTTIIVPTATPNPTATAIPSPTLTATPVAMDGVAEVDGTLYVFNEKLQQWVALPVLDAVYDRVVVNRDDKVVALDINGREVYTLKEGNWVETGSRLILVGFDPKMNEIMREMAEANITYKPLMNEFGTELRQGIFWVEDVGSGEFLYISATVMGLVDLEKTYPGVMVDSHAVVMQVEREDGTKVLFPVEFWRGSEKGTMKTSTVFLRGPVIEGIIGTDWEIVRTTHRVRHDYFVQKFPTMIGQQIVVSIPRSYEDTDDQYYESVLKLKDVLSGLSSEDVTNGTSVIPLRFPENPGFIIPDDGTRP